MRTLVRLFRFLLRLQGVIVTGVEVDKERDRLLIRIRRHGNAKARCSTCGRVMGGRLVEEYREWRHLDIMGVQTYLASMLREGRCRKHGRRKERVPWAQSRAHHTHEFDRQVASLVQVADRTAVSRMFTVAWRTVGRMVERVVDRYLPKDRFADVTSIGIDETSYKRGHRYLTVVSCLQTGRVLWVGEGKSSHTLAEFFREFGKQRSQQLELVAMDMSGGYRKALEAHAPNAEIVYDRFHVVQLLLKAIDQIRRDEVRKSKAAARRPLKKTRFTLLSNPARYTEKDYDAIARILRSNRRLTRAWELRVDFEELWNCTSAYEARQFLNRWTRSALLSRQEPLRRFAKTVREHMEGILNFFYFGRTTNAVLEGMNNKIKLLIHRAFGFRSIPALIAMIHLCCSGIDLQ